MSTFKSNSRRAAQHQYFPELSHISSADAMLLLAHRWWFCGLLVLTGTAPIANYIWHDTDQQRKPLISTDPGLDMDSDLCMGSKLMSKTGKEAARQVSPPDDCWWALNNAQ